jgi:hypothetical protein
MFNPERSQEFSIKKNKSSGLKEKKRLEKMWVSSRDLIQFPRNLQLSQGCKT